jgi:hypothetical protein
MTETTNFSTELPSLVTLDPPVEKLKSSLRYLFFNDDNLKKIGLQQSINFLSKIQIKNNYSNFDFYKNKLTFTNLVTISKQKKIFPKTFYNSNHKVFMFTIQIVFVYLI